VNILTNKSKINATVILRSYRNNLLEIRSSVASAKFDYYNGEYATSLLEKMEIDPMQQTMFTNNGKQRV
jgi:hypothetical protein